MRIIVTVSLAVVLAFGPLAGVAQQAAKISRIGFLSPQSPLDPGMPGRLAAFRQGLRELGYVEGRDIAIEFRWAEGKYERLPGLAAELIRLKVDVVVTYAPPAIQAARQASETTPIVMAGIIDPVATGFVASLARPGGNVTGLTLMAPELVGKQVELLREVVPRVSRVAVLGNPANAGNAPQLRHAQEAARTLGLRLQTLEAREPGEIDTAFAAMTSERAGAVVVLVDAMLLEHRTRIAELAATRRLPAVYGLIDHAEAGGLMAYGGSVRDRCRRTASFVDKILKGARPAGPSSRAAGEARAGRQPADGQGPRPDDPSLDLGSRRSRDPLTMSARGLRLLATITINLTSASRRSASAGQRGRQVSRGGARSTEWRRR